MFARIIMREWWHERKKQGRKFRSAGLSVRKRSSHPVMGLGSVISKYFFVFSNLSYSGPYFRSKNRPGIAQKPKTKQYFQTTLLLVEIALQLEFGTISRKYYCRKKISLKNYCKKISSVLTLFKNGSS